MLAFARLLSSRTFAAVVVVVTLGLAAVMGRYAARLPQDDDVLAFIPEREAAQFRAVGARFGALDVVLVGVEADDVFDADFLARLKSATRALGQTEGVAQALSLASLEDVVDNEEKGGVSIAYLVTEPPTSDAEREALRRRVLSRETAVGNVVAADGKAVLIICFLVGGTDTKAALERIKSVVEPTFARERRHYGGAPAVSSWVLGTTQRDLSRLGPFVGLAIVLVTFLTVRSALRGFVALAATGSSISITVGLMTLLGIKANLVVGTLPILLLALGIGLPMAMLVERGGPEAVLARSGRGVLGAGALTAVGLASCFASVLPPMVVFGRMGALGMLVLTAVTFVFVPAALALLPRREAKAPSRRLTGALVEALARHPLPLVAVPLGALALGLALLGRVDTRVDSEAVFGPGSPPILAEELLRTRFGGSQFVQVELAGDMRDADVLREVEHLADRLALLPDVAGVQHVGMVLSTIGQAMSGDYRVPDASDKVATLYTFLEGKQAVRQLVTDDRRHALLQVKLAVDRAGDVERALSSVERVVREWQPGRFRVARPGEPGYAEGEARARARKREHVRALLKARGARFDDARLSAALEPKPSGEGAAGPTLIAAVTKFLKSDECTAELAEGVDVSAVAKGLAALSPSGDDLQSRIDKVLADAGDKESALNAKALARALRDLLRREGARDRAEQLVRDAGIGLPEGEAAPRLLGALGGALGDPSTTVVVPGEGPLSLEAVVTGQPVLNRAMGEGVRASHQRSAVTALALVLAVGLGLFRSAKRALALTALGGASYLGLVGGATLFGVRMDLGTTMLPALCIGAAGSFGAQLFGLLPGEASSPRALGDAVGPGVRAVLGNALAVAAGMGCFLLAESKPLRSLGGLTAAALVGSALLVLAALPALGLSRPSATAGAGATRGRSNDAANDAANDRSHGDGDPEPRDGE
jgi:predicted RND superfamily exporter protein